jgi:predicted XRE-type DNA-binding protein
MSDIEITKSSGNVFADLGLPDADIHFVKAKMVSNILDIMRDQGLTQTKAAELMGITQPEISRFSNGHFRDVTAERLMRLLTRLGCEVDIVVQPKGRVAYEPIHMQPVVISA